MHAIIVNVAIDPSRQPDAQGMLASIVVPSAKGSPGFVAGYWLASGDGSKGHSVEIYDSEAAAQAALDSRGEPPPGGPVTIVSAELMEVAASA